MGSLPWVCLVCVAPHLPPSQAPPSDASHVLLSLLCLHTPAYACAISYPSPPRMCTLLTRPYDSLAGGWTCSGLQLGGMVPCIAHQLTPQLDTRPVWLHARAHLHDPYPRASPYHRHACACILLTLALGQRFVGGWTRLGLQWVGTVPCIACPLIPQARHTPWVAACTRVCFM